MPPKLRAKPQQRSAGAGTGYRCRARFNADLAAWCDERDARNALMAERRRAQERARDARRDRSRRQQGPRYRDRRKPAQLVRDVGAPKPAPLTEADLPPIPPRLKRDATEAEMRARNAIMETRVRVLKSLRYQQRMRTRDVEVVVPEGVAPGQSFAITTPDGSQLTMTCPWGVGPGDRYIQRRF